MNDLIEALEHLSARGTPRGADVVFDAAVEASRRADAPLPDGSPGSRPSPATDVPKYVSGDHRLVGDRRRHRQPRR